MSSPQQGLNQGTDPNDAQRKLHDLLESMWELRKGTVVDRLNVLEAAVKDLHQSKTLASREQGIDAAHKLAGILGTFGLPQGTEMAREIEVAMGVDGQLDAREIAHLQQVVGQLAQLIAQRTLPTAR
jgi:HPt (histidine-containing phosphotransfer) domain-containing protein